MKGLFHFSTSGFTLVEAVLALAILSIGLFALMEATSKCLAVVRQSKNYQTARAVLDRGELEHPLVRTNEVERNAVSETYDGYTFSREVQAVDGEKGLYLVTTRVSGAKPDQPPLEEVVSCLFCPEAALNAGGAP